MNPFDGIILDAPILEGDKQSLSGTRVNIPGIGEVVFAPTSASDFPDMNMTHQELIAKFWMLEIRIQDLTTRLQSLELMTHDSRSD